MDSLTDQQLLRDYARRRSEAAFAELVRRQVDFVYSAALRMVRDAHLAEDVTQGVFVALAQNARQLTGHPVLAGWLHRTAQNLAANAVRTDVRRRAREQEAAIMSELLSAEPDAKWEHIAPQLDAALGELNEVDRDALLLRYFQGKSARQMAQTLGMTEEAAQRRVSRAVERLRELFAKRGMAVSATGLVAVVTAHAVQAAPAALAGTICTAAATALTTTTIATHASMNWISLKALAAIVASAVVAGTATHVIQHRETDRLRNENQNLLVQQVNLAKERDEAVSVAANRGEELDAQRKNQSDLLRLRSEVGQLRAQQKELATLRAENQKLLQFAKVAATQNVVVAQVQTAKSGQEAERDQCINNLRQIDGAMQQCALENRFGVTNVIVAEQILPYFPGQQFPRCPAGGTYTFGSLTNVPTCSIPGHTLQQ